MKHVRWLLRRWARQMGWRSMAGLGLVMLAGVVYLGAAIPAQTRLTDLQEQARSVREFARAAGRSAASGTERTDSQLAQFYALLPDKASAPDWLGKIFAAARSESLLLEQGDYKFRPGRNGRVASYEISLPVRGTYVQVQGFIAGVLDAVPAAALDDVVLKRDAIGSPEVEAGIRFTLFMSEG